MLPGREWPIFDVLAASFAQNDSEHTSFLLDGLSAVPSGSSTERWEQYQRSLGRNTEPLIWLYQSRHLNGRVPGPVTFQLKRLYEDAGVEIVGAELPDHISVEFAFLAYLSKQIDKSPPEEDTWQTAKKLFIKKHAGKWIPNLAKKFIRTEYPAWQSVGDLILTSLEVKKKPQPVFSKTITQFPTILEDSRCTLCGFCVQTCPTQALKIQENDQTTQLTLTSKLCTGCSKCQQICFTQAMQLTPIHALEEIQVLYSSERATCPKCQIPTVSKAELAFTSERLGNPIWLDYCLNCR